MFSRKFYPSEILNACFFHILMFLELCCVHTSACSALGCRACFPVAACAHGDLMVCSVHVSFLVWMS